MLRRIAITLAAITAAGFMAAAPAAAVDFDTVESVGGYHVAGERAGLEYVNLGGPYGITYAKASMASFEGEGGYTSHGYSDEH